MLLFYVRVVTCLWYHSKDLHATCKSISLRSHLWLTTSRYACVCLSFCCYFLITIICFIWFTNIGGGGGIEECCGSLEACSKKYLRNGCRYFKPSSMNIIFFFIVIILVIVFSGNSGSLFIIATTIFLFTVEV